VPTWNPERSLFPQAGTSQPFSWRGVDSYLEQLRARVDRVFATPLPRESLSSLRQWFRTHHVFHSNAIEGSTLTLYETQVVIGDGLTVGGKPLRDVLAAKNLAHALDWVEAHARAEPLSERFIREIHGLVLRGEDELSPGAYKRVANRVAGAQFRTPPVVQTAPLMEALASYLMGPMEADALLSACVAHAWFVGIHPFQDGNGRTARLLSNVVLLRRAYPVALLSSERRPEYYAALDKAHCSGDLSDFIRLWCACLDATLDEYEQLNSTMQVRDRDIEYFANAINVQRPSTDLEAERWRVAVANIANELEAIAGRLQERLKVEARVEVRREAVEPTTLKSARSGGAPTVLLVKGALPASAFQGGVALAARPGAETLFLTPIQWGGSTPIALERIELEGGWFTLVWRDRREARQSAAQVANAVMGEILEHVADLGRRP
jgi:Fic family protein